MKLVCQNSEHGYLPSTCHVQSDVHVGTQNCKNPYNLEMLHSTPPHYKILRPRKLVIRIGDGNVLDCVTKLTELQKKIGFLDDAQIIELHDGGNWQGAIQMCHAIKKLAPATTNATYHRDASIPEGFPLCAILQTGVGLALHTTGPYDDNLFSQETIGLLDNFLFVGGNLQIECLNPTSRADVKNYFFGLFCKDVPLLAYRAPTVTLDDSVLMADPLSAMVSIYDECRVGTADYFHDFFGILFKMQFRFINQTYDILNSYSRFEEAFNPSIMHMDLDGFEYLSSKFVSESVYGDAWNTSQEVCLPLPADKFLKTNQRLRNRCRGCPVLPLCFGGDPWITEEQEEKECLQKFAHYAPIWTYFMNGRILYGPIWGIAEAGFKHRELYEQFLNSDVYKTAVGKP